MEGLTLGAVAWVRTYRGIFNSTILDENINYIVDLVGTAKDAH